MKTLNDALADMVKTGKIQNIWTPIQFWQGKYYVPRNCYVIDGKPIDMLDCSDIFYKHLVEFHNKNEVL